MQRPPARPQELISPTEAAQRRGVSVSTATRAMAGTLADAVVDGKLNAAHPLASKWLKQRPKHGPLPGWRSASSAADGSPPADLNHRKKAAEVALLEAKVQRDSGRLISRALVQHHVFGLLDSTFKRLLTDFPINAASRLSSLVRTGAPLEEQVSLLRSLVGVELRSLKPLATRALRHCSARGHLDPSNTADTPKASPKASAVQAFAAALQAELASVAVPRIVDLVAKELARKAAGKPWAPEVFDQAMALVDSVRSEAVHASTVIISSAVAEAMRQTLSTHQEIPDDQNPQETSEETDDQADEEAPGENEE